MTSFSLPLLQDASSARHHAGAPLRCFTATEPRPVTFRRYCSLCMSDIIHTFVVGRDPKWMTPAEKQAYFSVIGIYTVIDPSHQHPLCSSCAEAITPHLDSALHLDPETTVIERRHYHGRVRHGRIHFLLSVSGVRKKWTDALVSAIAYRLLVTTDSVWCDGAWRYGQGYTFEWLKPRRQAQFLGLKVEQVVA